MTLIYFLFHLRRNCREAAFSVPEIVSSLTGSSQGYTARKSTSLVIYLKISTSYQRKKKGTGIRQTGTGLMQGFYMEDMNMNK